MSSPARIYLDNAATSWPKPEAVYQAVDHYQRSVGASSGRGGYPAAEEVRTLIERTRERLARLLDESDSRRVCFTASATDALSTALFGLLRPGDHVVTSVCEHHSVLRPLHGMQGVSFTEVLCNQAGELDPQAFEAALRPETRLIAVTHASNVTGVVQPVAEIAAVARRHGVRVLVDGAQTMGKIPLSPAELGIDLLAAPGHKGLLGPLGTGFLWIGQGVEHDLEPLRRGGTGVLSELDDQPDVLPVKYESGSLNAPGLAGLEAALAYLDETGIQAKGQQVAAATARLRTGLESLGGVQLYGAAHDLRAGVVSFTAEGYAPQELALLLSNVAAVECRAGLHCAPQMHRALGTYDEGGTVRFSPSGMTTKEEIDCTIEAFGELLAAGAPANL